MRSIARLVVAPMPIIAVVAGLAGAACQGSSDRKPPPPTGAADRPGAPGAGQPAPATPDYARDIEKLCDAVHRSGADQLPANERAMPMATWLAANLTTPEAHAFLVRIQPLVGGAKADALEAEARRVGLGGCALAAEWR